MVPITTVIKAEPHSISIYDDDLSSGKLPTISRIKVDKIFTIDKNLIIKRIAKLNDKISKKVMSELKKVI